MKKELAKSDFKIKTMKKEAKESVTQHNKILKKKDETIENLQHFKTLKNSEEINSKLKRRKSIKKLKSLEERESQLLKKNQNHIIPNNNEVPKTLIYPCSPISLPPNLTTNYSNFVQSLPASLNISNVSLYPSTVSYWLPPPCELASNDFVSSISHRLSILSDKPNQSSTTSVRQTPPTTRDELKLIENLLETMGKKLDKWNKTGLDILRKSAL